MNMAAQFSKQAFAAVAVAAYTAVATWATLKVCEVACGGLRVTPEEEEAGLDSTSHGETAYVGDKMTPGLLNM
jgi:Amt family ammonium transporter